MESLGYKPLPTPAPVADSPFLADEAALADFLGVFGDALKTPIIFDGRNLYRRPHLEEMGFTYVSIGRQTVRPAVQDEPARQTA